MPCIRGQHPKLGLLVCRDLSSCAGPVAGRVAGRGVRPRGDGGRGQVKPPAAANGSPPSTPATRHRTPSHHTLKPLHPPPPTPNVQAPSDGDGREHNDPNGPNGHCSSCVVVAQGAARSLRAGTDEERIADFVHGADGFGDVGLPPPKVGMGRGVKAKHVVNGIVEARWTAWRRHAGQQEGFNRVARVGLTQRGKQWKGEPDEHAGGGAGGGEQLGRRGKEGLGVRYWENLRGPLGGGAGGVRGVGCCASV